jgi:DMSO reductase iron-sulfur subunit
VSEQEFSLVDFFYLENGVLPLKKRVNGEGLYAPSGKLGTPLAVVEGQNCGVPSGRRRSLPVAREEDSLIPAEPLKPGEQYRFHFDMSRCIGCQCCVVACNEQNNNPAGVNWRRVGEIEGGEYPNTKRFHLSMACNHCLDPSCLTGCPTDAYVKLENGVVKHKAEECIGCGYCTWNCPYSVPQFNPERKIVTKCDMCHDRLADGQEPACVAACPEQAIRIEKVNVEEWRKDHDQADAPHVPESGITISTTRITLPKDIPTEVLKANRHRIEPEKPHTPLIFMTVLTQLAAGSFLTLWLGELLSHVFDFLKPLQDFMVFGACGILTVTALALLASVFHLGRPLYAYKALKMWKRSWLSREVLLFTLFSFFGAAFATLLLAGNAKGLSVPYGIRVAFGGFVALFGMAGIFASAKIYLVPARPAWNTLRTPLRFFLTGFILGPLFGLLVYSLYLLTRVHGKISDFYWGPIGVLLAVSSAAAFLQLLMLVARLFSLRPGHNEELHGSAFLLLHRFRGHFLVRIGLLVLGNFLIPLWMFNSLSLGKASLGLFVGVVSAAFFLSLLGELLGRYLFFVTVVPKNMPGSFFTTNGGSHS